MVVQLKALIKRENPDLLVIAGDIYDVPAPGNFVQKQFSGFVLDLKTAAPHMSIVCISGNHDSSSRHEIYQEPWEALNVHMIGKADMAHIGNNIINIPGKGRVVAVPYTNERFLDDEFYLKLEEKVREVATDKLPVVYVGHAAIYGCNFAGHSNMNGRYIGGIECTGIEQLGECYDYIALGHIHKAQTFGNGKARYCGSPLPVSFDEVRTGYDHGFTVVEIESEGAAPVISHITLDMVRPLVNIPSEGYAPWTDVMKELKSFPPDIPAYIRLNVLLKDNENFPYDKEAQILRAMEGKAAMYAHINPIREYSVLPDSNEKQIQNMTMEELQKVDPVTILKEYARLQDTAFTEEFEKMFEMVMQNLDKNTGNED